MSDATRTDSQSELEKITLEAFYSHVMKTGKLRTTDHARRWTVGTLNMLGVNLRRGLKKQLAKELPSELSEALTGVFWLAHFRNPNLPAQEFCQRVSRRSRASSDPDFARFPVQAVFGGLKRMISLDLNQKIQEDLAPELSAMWKNA